jgi:tetratricopeptide (TPR) repeat protein
MGPSGACRSQLLSTFPAWALYSLLFLGLLVLPSRAQLPPQPGAPAGDVSNLSRPVIETLDSINARNGPDEARKAKKTLGKDGTCLLPPLTLASAPTVAAEQLRIPAKASREYEEACSSLRRHKPADAEKHLHAAIHEYAKYSVAWVTLGQVLATETRPDEAQQACSRASVVEPSFAPAYLCLADLAARAHDWPEVLKSTERVLQLGPLYAVVAYEYDAAANLNLHNLAAAEKSGLRAVQMDLDHREPRSHFVLAQIYEAKGDKENEARQLREYLKYADNAADVAAVRNFLLQLETRAPTNHAAGPALSNPYPQISETPRRAWAPADIDDAIPPVQVDAACPLQQILNETSRRTQDLIASLQRFSADERIEQIDIDKNGNARSGTTQLVNYVAQINNSVSGYPQIREYRSAITEMGKTSVVDMGTATFALIFHPTHIGSFEFRCEGVTQSQGGPAWQLHFEEILDSSQSFHAIRVGADLYLPRLKGRAWIARDSSEVLRIETDLASPIPQIGFNLEHLVINYAHIEFKSRSVRLWVPESSALYIAYRGHRYERRHTFDHFHLFSVDSDQAIKEPATPPKTPLQLLPIGSKLIADASR